MPPDGSLRPIMTAMTRLLELQLVRASPRVQLPGLVLGQSPPTRKTSHERRARSRRQSSMGPGLLVCLWPRPSTKATSVNQHSFRRDLMEGTPRSPKGRDRGVINVVHPKLANMGTELGTFHALEARCIFLSLAITITFAQVGWP